MSRLELIVMPAQDLSPDEIRGLLDAYAEGELDDERAQAVKAALEQDEALKAEYDEVRATLELFHAVPRPDAPTDMVARVRAQLAAEKAEALAAAEASRASSEPEPQRPRPLATEPPAGFGWWPAAALTAAAACGLAFAFFWGPVSVDNGGTQAAGVGAEAQAVADLEVTGVSLDVVRALARAHHLESDSPDGLVFTGERDDVMRFRLALLGKAAEAGGQVTGFLPEAERVELRVSVRPTR